MEGVHDGRPPDDWIVGVPAIAVQGDGAGVPIVDVEHVDRRPAARGVCPDRLERSPAEHPEPPGIVRLVVEAVAVEGRRMVHEPEAVAIGCDIDDPDGRGAAAGEGVRDRHLDRRSGIGRDRDRSVARQEHIDRGIGPVGYPAERPRQGVDHVAEPASLGPRLALGGDHRDAHRPMVATAGSPRVGLLNRFTPTSRRGIIRGRMEPAVQVPTLPGAMFRLPPPLEGLRRLAYNLYWGWHPDAKRLFTRIDPVAWARYRNPIQLLSGSIDWGPLLEDPGFMAEARETIGRFDAYLANGSDHWFHRQHASALRGPIAYFCAEYGIHESLGIYSGGLGVLAGDHMKSASDMALPLIGVGLMYRRGYFRQSIDWDGHQEHAYPDYDLTRLPVLRATGPDGDPLRVSIALPDRELVIAVWVAQVGRVPVLLLDTDIVDNSAADRPITHMLYVRGREMRLHQELVLGIGGVRAIRALGVRPSAWHLNEGHSAFLLAERARELVAAGEDLEDAWPKVSRNSVFTIHTPVSAGNERFEADLVRRMAGPVLEGVLRPDAGRVPIETLLELGRGVDGDPGQFDLTALSLRLTNGANAVSQLHAVVANDTWAPITGEKRILGITNGVHTPTWLGTSMRRLYERYLELDLDDLDAKADMALFWERIDRIPADRPVGCPPAPEARVRRVRQGPAAGPVRSSRRGAGDARGDRRRARPAIPDDRLRPPVRDVQAGRAAVLGPRPPGPPRLGH